MAGASLGADYRFLQDFYAGVLGAYTDSSIKWSEGMGKGSVQSAYAGAYFSALGKTLYANTSLLGSLNHFHEKRTILGPNLRMTANNSHGGSQLAYHLDTGINLGLKGFTIRPFDAFDAIYGWENAFTESGADALDLSVRKSRSTFLRNELGLSFCSCLCYAHVQWMLAPKISWVREVRTKGSTYTAAFVDTDVPFSVTGIFPDRSLVSPGMSLTGRVLSDRLTFSLYYNGEFRGGYSDHSYGGLLRFGF
jgi:outer membrane autotransporter protein